MKPLRQRLFSGLSAMSLLLFIVTSGLWVRSKIEGSRVSPYFQADNGKMNAFATDGEAVFKIRSNWNIDYSTAPHRRGFAILWVVYRHFSWRDGRYELWLQLPITAFMFLFAILPGFWITHFRRSLLAAKRTSRNLCSSCGYDLRATPNRCPECGRIRDKVI
jgi:hypothetical protein